MKPGVGFMIAMLLVIVGGLNWGIHGLIGKDLFKPILGKWVWIVYVIVGLAAAYIGFSRDTYLPFLGPSVVPCSLLKDQVPEGATTHLQIHTQPGAKILFWASEPATEDLKTLKNWREAYLGFKNAGVTTADQNGMATLSVRTPQPYTVPRKGRLNPHIHYRICGENGMIGRVETTFVKEDMANESETFNRVEDVQEPFENAGAQFETSYPPSTQSTDQTLQQIAENTERAMFVNQGLAYEKVTAAGSDLDSAFAM